MRTSLANLQNLDKQVLNTAEPGEKLLFDAKLMLDPALRSEVSLHKQTLDLVQKYGREELIGIIKNVHWQLFNLPKNQSFRQKILRLFAKL